MDPDPSPQDRPKADTDLRRSLAIGVATMATLAAVAVVLWRAGLVEALWDQHKLREAIARLGLWGPAALIALEAIAIVLTPIPSGPIAVVGGALFGPVWGTLYVVIGAVAGAMIAFTIARRLGYSWVRRWSRSRRIMRYLEQDRSQWWLMAVVFASRLIPFISFDAVSYAAGLTPLSHWRFMLATIAGVIPISFLLTFAGEELAGADSTLLWIVLGGLTVMTVVPLAIRWLWRLWVRRSRR